MPRIERDAPDDSQRRAVVVAWARFDDNYTDHPKVVQAGPMAELLDMRAIIYCARYETDGFISARALTRIGQQIAKPAARAARLVEVGRWTKGEGGWWVNDYLAYNPSKAQKTTEREASRTRQEVYRTRGFADQVKARDGDVCRYCGDGVNWKDRRGSHGAVFEHVHPVTQGGETTIDNIVIACRGCNTKKGGRTPEQAGMTLISKSDLGAKPRSVGSGRESLSNAAARCANCDLLACDCACGPELKVLEGGLQP